MWREQLISYQPVTVIKIPSGSAVALCAGSRSSPLALAAASHPRTQLTVAIDERSLGFWALGYGRANASGACSSLLAAASLPAGTVAGLQYINIWVQYMLCRGVSNPKLVFLPQP